MKKIKKIAIGVIVGLTLTTLSASDCWKMKNNDDKRWCESIYEGKDNCWQIQEKDRQNYCKAKKGKTTCWQIRGDAMRNMCKSETGQ